MAVLPLIWANIYLCVAVAVGGYSTSETCLLDCCAFTSAQKMCITTGLLSQTHICTHTHTHAHKHTLRLTHAHTNSHTHKLTHLQTRQYTCTQTHINLWWKYHAHFYIQCHTLFWQSASGRCNKKWNHLHSNLCKIKICNTSKNN